MTDAARVAALREALPAAGAGIYLNAPVAGPLPAESAAAMDEISRWEVTTGRAHRDRPHEVAARLDEARAGIAAVLTSDLDDVAIAHGRDDALARAVRGLPWTAGGRILVVADDELAGLPDVAPPGLAVDLIEPVDGRPASILEAVEGGLARGAALLALPVVATATGARLPVEEAARLAHARGAAVLVEASLAVGAVPVDPAALGADLLVARTEAWLLGPEGLAAVAGRGVRQSVTGFHLPSVVGLARGVGWLSMYVGLPWVHERGASLTAHLARRLEPIGGVTLLTPAERATTLAFRIRGWDASAVLEELGGRIFLLASVVGTGAPAAVRVGIGFWNTEAELDRLAEAVGLLAAHTPETLPRRPRLTILGQA